MHNLEMRKLTTDDYQIHPQCFQNEIDADAEMFMFANYGMLFTENREKPYYYFRHCSVDSIRWGGIIDPSDNPLGTQTSAHHRDIAQKETVTSKLLPTSDGKGVYLTSKNPYSLFEYKPEGFLWQEGNNASILDLKCKPFPFGVVVHQSDIQDSYIIQYVECEGTYEGKPVRAMCCDDRIFRSTKRQLDVASPSYTYTLAIYSGIREDGRKELFDFYIKDQNGHANGLYWLEGEEPVVTDNAYIYADWVHLPYVDDGTVIATNITFKCANKTIHYTGKWGTKGFTEKPRIERTGQSQSLGTWYEGDTPYKHVIWNTLNENMDCTAERIIRMGNKVID